MPKDDFVRFLGENEVSVFHFDSDDEFAEELANAVATAHVTSI